MINEILFNRLYGHIGTVATHLDTDLIPKLCTMACNLHILTVVNAISSTCIYAPYCVE